MLFLEALKLHYKWKQLEYCLKEMKMTLSSFTKKILFKCKLNHYSFVYYKFYLKKKNPQNTAVGIHSSFTLVH